MRSVPTHHREGVCEGRHVRLQCQPAAARVTQSSSMRSLIAGHEEFRPEEIERSIDIHRSFRRNKIGNGFGSAKITLAKKNFRTRKENGAIDIVELLKILRAFGETVCRKETFKLIPLDAHRRLRRLVVCSDAWDIMRIAFRKNGKGSTYILRAAERACRQHDSK